MDEVRKYLLSVLSAAMICAVIHKLSVSKSGAFRIVRLTASIFLSVTIIAPVLKVQISGFSSELEQYKQEAEGLAVAGAEILAEEKLSLIKENTETYILEKAADYGVSLEVEVQINDPALMLPDQVTLKGNVSPYAKQLIQNCISEDLGIPKEHQLWK